jgi:Na+/H+-dicarboxylate symporter
MKHARTRLPLVLWLLLAIALGAVTGLTLGPRAARLGDLGMLVITLLKALATPLVFLAVVDSFVRATIPAKKGVVLLVLCVINASVAGGLAVLLSSLLQPGAHANITQLVSSESTRATTPATSAATGHVSLDFFATLKSIVPESVIEPLVTNKVLSVVLLAVLSGLALRSIGSEEHANGQRVGAALRALVADLFRLAQKLLEWVIRIVPFAVFGVVAKVVGEAGLGIFVSLGALIFTVALGLFLHVSVYYSLLLALIARVSPLRFFAAASEAIVTALGTGSSMATLPVTLRTLEEKLKISASSARLAACVGTNFNNDGIMLYEVVAALFVAQISGIHLSAGDKASLCVTSALAASGIAGVPEAGFITLSLVLTSVRLPVAALPVILTVDWMLGRLRAATNVVSDLVIATLLDRLSGRTDDETETRENAATQKPREDAM